MAAPKRLKVKVAVFILIMNGRVIPGRNQVLFMRRKNTGHEDGMLGLPSGHVEPGELPLDAAVRELFEETGIKVSKETLQLIHTQYNHSKKNGDYINLFFLPSVWSGEPRIAEPEMCSELLWVNQADTLAHEQIISYVQVMLRVWVHSRGIYSESEYIPRA
jgi:8-oxo-dGTP diphosphatase